MPHDGTTMQVYHQAMAKPMVMFLSKRKLAHFNVIILCSLSIATNGKKNAQINCLSQVNHTFSIANCSKIAIGNIRLTTKMINLCLFLANSYNEQVTRDNANGKNFS